MRAGLKPIKNWNRHLRFRLISRDHWGSLKTGGEEDVGGEVEGERGRKDNLLGKKKKKKKETHTDSTTTLKMGKDAVIKGG